MLSAFQAQCAVRAYYIFSFNTQNPHSPFTLWLKSHVLTSQWCLREGCAERVDSDRNEGVTGRGLSDVKAVGGDTVGMETGSQVRWGVSLEEGSVKGVLYLFLRFMSDLAVSHQFDPVWKRHKQARLRLWARFQNN